jgi:hypothetical protein
MGESRLTGIVWLLVAVAFALPTGLDISWDGLPFNHRAELVFLLFGVLVVVAGLARRLVGDAQPTAPPSWRHAAAIGSLAVALIVLKAVFPASGGISRCWWAPHVALNLQLSPDACLYAGEPFVSSIDFGPGGKPWLPGLLNTNIYNYYRCRPGDTVCEIGRKWRERDALPFRASFALPPSTLPKEGEVPLLYAGRAELELRQTGGDVERVSLPYSPTPAERRVNFSRIDLAGVRLIYWNYACPGPDPESPRCLSSPETETLPRSQAMLRVSLPEPGWRIASRRVAELLTLALVGLIGWVVARTVFRQARDLWPVVDWKVSPAVAAVVVAELGLLNLLWLVEFRNHPPWVVIPVAFAGALSAVLLVLWGNLGGRGGPKDPTTGAPVGTADVLCSFPVLCLWIWTALRIPPTDALLLQTMGNDWLTFTSEAYFLAASPHWFANQQYVFSKPLFMYFRASFYPLLGEGTVYFGLLLNFVMGCIPLLLVPLAMKSFQSRSGLLRLAGFAVFGGTFIWALGNFGFLVGFAPSMSEVPAWICTLLGSITLVYSIDEDDRPRAGFDIVALAAVLCGLALLMRPQAIAAWIPLWALAIGARAGAARRRASIAAAASVVGAALIILVHAVPALLTQRHNLVRYLGLTTEVVAPSPLPVLLATFWRRAAFEPLVGWFLVLGGLLGTVFVGMRSREPKAPLGFAACYLAAIALHLGIKDNAYLPRHYVLMAHTAAYLTLYCSIRILGELDSRRLERRMVAAGVRRDGKWFGDGRRDAIDPTQTGR